MASEQTRLVDVYLIARDFVARIGEKSPLEFPINIQKSLIPLIESSLSGEKRYPITLRRKDWRSSQYYSTLFRYEEWADIFYSADLNTCWKRLAICKELAHLLIDSEKTHFTTDVVSLIQQLITNAPVLKAESPLESEWMGIVAAVEILMPWAIRSQMYGWAEEGKTDFEIAEFCRVPEKFVNLILRSNYGATSKEINTSLD